MLKVVGASWLKTRISTYILLGAGILAIGSLFVAEMERPQFDGTYCATVFWTKQTGFQVEYWKQRNDLLDIPKGAARTCYKDSTQTNGWSQLEIETQRNYPDWVQAFAAGILEGTLTWNSIHNQVSNTISYACDRDDDTQNFCTWLRDTLADNYEMTKKRAETQARHSAFWYQVRLFYYQLEGLQAGWKKGVKRSRSGLEIDPVDFLLLNAAADIPDLRVYYEKFVMHSQNGDSVEPEDRSKSTKYRSKRSFIPTSSMFVKLINANEEGWKVLFGQSASGSYSSMLRIQKRYKFRFRMSEDTNSNTVPGSEVIFTSYPGVLASTDDFYLVKGRQTHSLIAGIPIRNHNPELWKQDDLKEAIPLAVRAMAANRLASTKRPWARIFSQSPVTGNKQWVIVDLRRIDSALNTKHSIREESSRIPPSSPSLGLLNADRKAGLIWIVEQYPGRLHAEDVTSKFTTDAIAWFTNGTPYFREIFDLGNLPEEFFVSSPFVRAELSMLKDVDNFLKMHAFRGDLLGDQSIPYGNIDIKLFSYTARSGQTDLHATAGPVHSVAADSSSNGRPRTPKRESPEPSRLLAESLVLETDNNADDIKITTEGRPVRSDMRSMAYRRSQGPFKWSNAEATVSNVRHDGQPDAWNFGTFTPKWAWLDER